MSHHRRRHAVTMVNRIHRRRREASALLAPYQQGRVVVSGLVLGRLVAPHSAVRMVGIRASVRENWMVHVVGATVIRPVLATGWEPTVAT